MLLADPNFKQSYKRTCSLALWTVASPDPSLMLYSRLEKRLWSRGKLLSDEAVGFAAADFAEAAFAFSPSAAAEAMLLERIFL